MDQHRSGAHNSRKGTRADSEGLWDWNLQSDRIHFSPRWIALVGCDDHEVGGGPDEWFRRVHSDDSAQVAKEIESARTGDATTFSSRHRLRHKDGTYRWMLCRGTVVRNKAGQAIRLTGSHSDVTVEMVTDPLTGLPNQLLLMDRLTHSIERSRRYQGFHFAAFVIDLGRAVKGGRKSAGDPLITAVARRLETSLRIPDMMPTLRSNDLVARMDGERFAILLDGLKEISHAKIVGERILREILEPFVLGGREVRLSASIGVALSATGYTKAEQVVHDAETALHRAHVLGGSRCEVFDTGILQIEQAELQIEGDFEPALQRGEFELFYQPIVSLASNELLGFEALVRWRHPVLGLISPADFLPVAEKTGFIAPLGNWILREACRRLSTWQTKFASARDVSISVNVSALELSEEALVDRIADALNESGLEPRRLILELTEGIAMANPTAVTTLLMRIRAMGVRISIDDFGTGYSSLAYLRQFPLDALKIDRSFVRSMVTNKDTAEIVASLIGMARQLGLSVVAEGIEHDDQLAQLRALNCDAGQGNLFAKPLDVERAAELVKTGAAPHPEHRHDPTTPELSDERISQESIRGGHFMTRHRRWVAAAAAVLVVAAMGLVVSLDAPAVTQQSISAPPRPAVEAVTAPVISPATVKEAPAPVENKVARASTTPPPAPSTPVSLDVVHLHRFGSCHGRLEITRDGIAFGGSDVDPDDAFAFKYIQFLHAMDGDTLTLKTATKTYRFKAEESRGGGASSDQIRVFANRITRARR